MEGQAPSPNTIDKLAECVLPEMALLAGTQLAVFTTLKDGPATTGEVAVALGVGPVNLRCCSMRLLPQDSLRWRTTGSPTLRRRTNFL